jgi:hypothetical protein
LTDLAEIAKLVGTLSIAIVSISVATYALAVPRLQTALSASIKQSRDSKAKLEARMKDASVTLDELEDQLKSIENEQTEIRRVISRLSWSRVVLMPTSLSLVALALDAVLMLLSSMYDSLLLAISIALVVGGLFHLLLSLRLIEQTAVRPGLSVEG